MASKRQQQFARLILRDLSEIFQKELRDSFQGAFVTLTGAKISPDLSVASIYVSVLPAGKLPKVMGLLEEQKRQIRGILGKKIGRQVRIVPELRFFADDTQEQASRIEELLDNLDIPPAEDDNE